MAEVSSLFGLDLHDANISEATWPEVRSLQQETAWSTSPTGP
jgi:hypothetical protein